MTVPRGRVLGISAPPPRPTAAGAFWLACAVSLPVGLVLLAVELAFRWLAG